MTDLVILNGLSDALRASYPNTHIILPNEPIDAQIAASDVFFDVAVTGRTWTRETEESTLSTAVGSIIINGRQNTGVGEVDSIADALLAYFAPLNFALRNGFTWTDGETVARAYVAELQRSESGIHNGRFKVTVFITFEIYEEKRNVGN